MMDGLVTRVLARALKLIHDEAQRGMSIGELYDKLGFEFGDDFNEVDVALWGEIRQNTAILAKNDDEDIVAITETMLNTFDFGGMYGPNGQNHRRLFCKELPRGGSKRMEANDQEHRQDFREDLSGGRSKRMAADDEELAPPSPKRLSQHDEFSPFADQTASNMEDRPSPHLGFSPSIDQAHISSQHHAFSSSTTQTPSNIENRLSQYPAFSPFTNQTPSNIEHPARQNHQFSPFTSQTPSSVNNLPSQSIYEGSMEFEITPAPVQLPPTLMQSMFAPQAAYVSPYAPAPTVLPPGVLPPPPTVIYQPYVHNNATVWKDILAPPPTPKSKPSAPRSSPPKNRKPRKRRSKANPQVPVEYSAEMEFAPTPHPLGVFRKRTSPDPELFQPPAQIHRPYNLAAPEMASNLAQAEIAIFPEVAARLACAFNHVYGNLVLSKDLNLFGFVQDVQPVPETPMLVLPITSIAENPIISAKGSNPMEIRIKVNDANDADDTNDAKTTYSFAFKETGMEPEPSQLMRNKLISAIVNSQVNLPRVNGSSHPAAQPAAQPAVQPVAQKSNKGKERAVDDDDNDDFGGDDDLPGVDDEDLNLPVAPNSNKGKEPERRETDSPVSKVTKSPKRKYQKSTNPTDPTKPYECSDCSKAWKQSWGLHYHLTQSNTTCNPYNNQARLAEKKKRSKKRGGLTLLNEPAESNESSFFATPSAASQAVAGQPASELSNTESQAIGGQQESQPAPTASESVGEQRPSLPHNHERENASMTLGENPSPPTIPPAVSPEDIALPEDLPEDFPTPTKKPRSQRGRVSKARLSREIRPEDILLPEDLPEDFTQALEMPKRKRGRPRKQPVYNAQAEGAGPSRQSEQLVNDTNEPRATISSRRERATTLKKTAPTHNEETLPDATESEDSAVEFYKTHNTTGVERPRRVAFANEPKISPTKKIYKALPFELPVLREVASELAAATSSETAIPSTSTETSIASASLASQSCEDVLISLVKDNHGIFPGDKSIWIAFAGAWLKKFPNSTMLPESKLCSKTVDHLIESKKLRSIELIWTDSKKRDVTRNILMLLGSKVSSKAMDELKAMIKQVYPDIYIPPQFAPPEPMLSKLNAVASRKLSLAEKDRLRFKEIVAAESESESDSQAQSPMQIDDESSDDDFKAGKASEEEAIDEDMEDDGDDVMEDRGDWQDEEPGHDHNRKKRKRLNTKSRQRDPEHNRAISDGVRRNWAARKATRGQNFFPNRKQRSADRKAKGVEATYLKNRCWDAPVAYMPDPETGAWNQDIKPKKIHRKSGRRPNEPRLPIVLTFMQAESGAWSFQPYGHGAPVVYARPARRRDEEGKYLERIHRDYRPVIFPTKNRVHLPAMLPLPQIVNSSNISRVTGLPKRKYQRKGRKERSTTGSRMSKDAGAAISAINRFPTFVLENAKDTKDPSKPAIDEVAILTFFEPPKLLPGAPTNIGLESLPPKFGLLASLYKGTSAVAHRFQPDYHNLKFSEPSIVTGGEDPNRGSWTVGVWQPVVSSRYSVTWDDATAMTMETLPFDKLDFAVDSDVEAPKKKKGGRKKRHKAQHVMIPPEQLTQNTRLEFTRIMTALPADLKAIFENPEDATKMLGVEVAKPNRAAKHNRRIKGKKAVLSARDEKRLIVTVIILRTLTGGLNCTIDWVIVSQSFQDYTCNFLAKYWNTLQHSKKEIIERLSDDFQEYFLRAYKRKQIPMIDFNKLTAFQWQQLVKWVIKNKHIDTSLLKKQKKLRSTDIEMSNNLAEIPLPPNAKSWRDQVLSDKTAHYKKLELATAEPRTMCWEEDARQPTEDEHRVVRSWVRAVALTPDEEYDLKFAQKKLISLVDKAMIKSIVVGLQEQKVLLRATRTRRFFGCVFEVTGKFLEPLNKVDVHVAQFVDAAVMKNQLDMRFWQGEETFPHSYFANPGNMMCVSSLQSQQMVTMETFKWPSQNKQLGVLDGGGYETRKIPRDLYKFDIVLKPTDKWVQDSDNEQLQKFLAAQPPRGSEAGEIPIWYGVTEKVNYDIWKRVLCSIGSFMHCRSATTVENIMEHFGSTFEEWELSTLLNWGTELGLFVRAGGGWDVGTWWWLMLGRVCNDGRLLGKGK
ncbi:hypothetical protein L207DRAFT_632601 [Hyaloscypha variabilis F]|uniref:C2H2-type domain-containing protein n=1 Tax=Hyaloscypha variabilis (strain UAMH 11265 / GT02V1 / F) TaxID=1149755 RepID=A0A2J6RRG6_HYAVF|nr:hypothetical protein L207DRAFT_632601 [Hyaloscypha variabilis F]